MFLKLFSKIFMSNICNLGKIKYKIGILLLFIFFSFCLTYAQQAHCIFHKDSVKSNLYSIVEVLTHDSLQGREGGTVYELKSAEYIKEHFKRIGLVSIFNDGSYFQEFEFAEGITLNDDNFFKINGKDYKLMTDYYPLNFSASTHIKAEIIRVGYGISFPERDYDDYEMYLNKSLDKDIKGKIFAIELGIPPELKGKKNTRYLDDLESKVSLAYKKGAAAVIFINSSKTTEPKLYMKRYEKPMQIPVIFAGQQAYKTIMDSNNCEAELLVKIEKNFVKSNNVIGYIDNNKPHTIVMGGHYDHLGLIKSKGVLSIHPGADDNASGISALIEIARKLKCDGFDAYNLMFIAFGAEEKGLLGSKNFVNSSAYPLDKISYMLNFDMVGRVDSTAAKLTIIGTSSSTKWDSILDITYYNDFLVERSEKVSGGSDHAPFYEKGIPVLFLSSRLHTDYHKPSDIIEKISFWGIYHVVDFANLLIKNTENIEKLPYFSTKTGTTEKSKRSSVSLGLTPDHTFDGVGLKVSDVAEDRPAVKGGILKGDIITKIDESEIRDIYSYMNALNMKAIGDTILVSVLREGKTIQLSVTLF